MLGAVSAAQCRLSEAGLLTIVLTGRHSRSRRSIFDNIFIEQGIDTGEDLLHCVQRIPALLQKTPDLPLRTVVVDSIGHIFRDAETATGGGSGNVHRDRTVLLFQVAALLKRLASQHNLLVLICNQVCSLCFSLL